jgi:hypothetical protein
MNFNRGWNSTFAHFTPVKPVEYEFDKEVRRLHLTPEKLETSQALRKWAFKHCHTRYVPEYLIEVWGLQVMDRGFGQLRLPGQK